MNYVVLGIGVLLTAAGSFAIYSGYDIVQIERGWTEVIAGTITVSGGIITIALALILSRLQELCALYKASVALPAAHVYEPAAKLPLTVPTLAERPEIAAAPEPEVASPLATPIFPRPPDAKKPKSIFSSVGRREPLNPSLAKPSSLPERLDEKLEPANLASRMEGEVQTPEVHAPPLGLSEATLPEPPVTSPPIPSLPVRPQPPASMRSSAALSIDEMWKRVSDEIDKPIFPYRAETSISKKDETDVAAAKSDEVSISETTPEETAPDHDELGRGPPKILDEIDSKIFERDAAETELSAFAPPDQVSDLGGETASLHVSEEPEAEDHWSIALRSSRNFARPRGDVQKEERFDFAAGARASRTEEPNPFAMSRSASALDDRFGHDDPPLNRFDTAWSRIGSDHSTRETIEKPLVDPPPVVLEPTVIGRYEAEETAYLMFSDGSIEAQSEKGIFRFASMADLKAFIENKQAAASSA